jgi:TolB-like protein
VNSREEGSVNGNGRVGSYEFGRFRLDRARQQLSDGEVPVALTPRAFDMLLYLVEHAGQLVEKAALMKAVWPKVIVEENNLSQHVSALRQALGDGSEGQRYIVTVPRRGYRFVADVRLSENATDGAPSRASVAVLPFVNVSGDPSKEYFGDGLAEELIHLLARVPGLAVPSRTSSFAYRGRAISLRDIAHELRVATVFEGSVRSAGERIRVTGQLIDAATGYHLWSQSFDRSFDDIFKLQDEIATAIVRAIRDCLSVALPALVTLPPPTRDPEAYRLYLQGASVGARGSELAVLEGIALLEQAIARDAHFARALGALAARRLTLVFLGRTDALQDSERQAREALALDSSLAEAHAALGLVNVVRRRWLDAEASFRRAQSCGVLDPTGLVHSLYLPASTGHLREALARLREAYDRAPASPQLLALLAIATIALPLEQRATEEAARYASLAVSLGMPQSAGPLPIVRLYVALRRGDRRDVIGAAPDVAAQLMPGQRESISGVIGLMHDGLSDGTARKAALDALDALAAEVSLEHLSPVMAVQLVAWYTMLNAVASAYELADRVLRRAAETEAMGMLLTWLWHPELRPFRNDPRFERLTARLGLMDYWRVSGPPDGYEIVAGKLIERSQ